MNRNGRRTKRDDFVRQNACAGMECRQRQATGAFQPGIYSPTRPASCAPLSGHGGKTQANQLFHEQPSAHRARSGVKGYYPLREPWHLLCHGGKTPAKLHVSLRPCAPAHAVRKRTQSATTVMSEPNHFSEMAAREPSAFISFRMSCTLSRRARSSLRKPMP